MLLRINLEPFTRVVYVSRILSLPNKISQIDQARRIWKKKNTQIPTIPLEIIKKQREIEKINYPLLISFERSWQRLTRDRATVAIVAHLSPITTFTAAVCLCKR